MAEDALNEQLETAQAYIVDRAAVLDWQVRRQEAQTARKAMTWLQAC